MNTLRSMQVRLSAHCPQLVNPFDRQHLRTAHIEVQNTVLTPSAIQPRQLICSGLIASVLFSWHHFAAVFARSSLSLFMVAILASQVSQSSPHGAIRLLIIIRFVYFTMQLDLINCESVFSYISESAFPRALPGTMYGTKSLSNGCVNSAVEGRKNVKSILQPFPARDNLNLAVFILDDLLFIIVCEDDSSLAGEGFRQLLECTDFSFPGVVVL